MPFEIDPRHVSEIREAYPRPIADAFVKGLRASGEVAAHQALLDFAETVLQYLALIAWFEYVAHGPRSEKLDCFVESVKKPSMGNWKDLFRDASKCNQTSVLSFSVTEKLASDRVAHQAAFVTCFDAVKKGLGFGIPPTGLGPYVEEQRRARQLGKLTMLGYWTKVVQCRNDLAHACDKRYPSGEDLLAILNGPLMDSVVELLLMDPVRRAMVDHPWAVPSKSNPHVILDDGRFVLHLTVQNRRDEFPDIRVSSSNQIERGSYLVRAQDQTLYVRFDWGSWPEVPRRRENVATPPVVTPVSAVDDRLAAAIARYETRYREYLLDDGVLSAKESSALVDLAELAGIPEAETAAVRARVEAEPKVIARLKDIASDTGLVDGGSVKPAPKPRRKWSEATFFAQVHEKHPHIAQSLRRIYDHALSLGGKISWGTGSVHGTFGIMLPWVTKHSVMTFVSSGTLVMYFGFHSGTEAQRRLRDHLET